jgi:hypothetical protein
MQRHLTMEDLLRFHDGSADGAEAIAIGRHLDGCGPCAALAREMFRDEAPRIASSLRNAPAEPARRPRLLAVAAAVALVAICAAVLLFILRRQPTPPPAHGYERAEWNALVRDALASGTVAVAAPAAAVSGDVLRGSASDSGGAMIPSATAVESPRPEFSWPAVPGAKFAVSVVAGEDVVARSGTLDRSHWTPEQPLTRGRMYAWQVRVLGEAGSSTLPAPPRPLPRFRVLADDEVRELAAARARHPHDHLLLGVLAAHHGLRGEARRELAAYAAEHPSPAAARLAASVDKP